MRRATALTLAFGALTVFRPDVAQAFPPLSAGAAAPSFTLRTLNPVKVERDLFALENYVGSERLEAQKAILIAFTAGSCGVCKLQNDLLEAMAEGFRDAHLVVVVVNTDDDDDVIAKVATLGAQSLAWLVSDRYHIAATRYGVTTVPVLFLVDENQKIAQTYAAYDDSAFESVVSATKQVLALSADSALPTAVSTALQRRRQTAASAPLVDASGPRPEEKVGKEARKAVGKKAPKKRLPSPAGDAKVAPKKAPKRVARPTGEQ